MHCSFQEVPVNICCSTYCRYYSKYIQKPEITAAPLQLRPNKWQVLMNVLVSKFIGTTATECEPWCTAHIHHSTHSCCCRFLSVPPAPGPAQIYFCYLQLVFFSSERSTKPKRVTHRPEPGWSSWRPLTLWAILLHHLFSVGQEGIQVFLSLWPKPRRLTFRDIKDKVFSVVHWFSKLFPCFFS